jgi:hypothetical protein
MFWNDTYKFVHMSIQCILYRLFYKELLKAYNVVQTVNCLGIL